MIVQFRFRRGTAAEWAIANPVLAEGEPGLDTTGGGFKIGDGVTPWNGLLTQSFDLAELNTNVADIRASVALAQAAADSMETSLDGYVPILSTPPDPDITPAYIDSGVNPPVLAVWDGAAWQTASGGGGTGGGGGSTPSTMAVVAIAAGKVPAPLTGFPMEVNLADLGDSFWTNIATNGSNLRVRESGTDLPFDLISIDKNARTGRLFFRADLTGAAQAFTIGGVTGATAPAVTDPLGRYAVWADFEAMYVGGDGVDRAGGGTLTTGTAGVPYLSAKSISPDVIVHQGVVRDLTGWVLIDTNLLIRYDLNWNEVTRNPNPIGSASIALADHTGDGCIVGRELFVPVQKYPWTTLNNQWIVVYDADTLAFKRKHDISSRGTDPSALCYCPQDGLLYAPNFNSATSIDRYSFTQGAGGTLTYVSSFTPTTPIGAIQSMEWLNGYFYIASQLEDTLRRMNFDGSSVRIVEAGVGESERDGGILEGLTADPSGNLNVMWADSPTKGSRIWTYSDLDEMLHYDNVSWDRLAPVAKFTTWTMGLSYRPDRIFSVGGPRVMMTYAASDVSATSAKSQIGQNSTSGTYALWNSTNSWLSGTVVPELGKRVRLHQKQNAASTRSLYVNGVLDVSGASAQRPGGLGDMLTLGAGDLLGVQPAAGPMDMIYLRNGLLSDAWLQTEQANWESDGFYTVSG